MTPEDDGPSELNEIHGAVMREPPEPEEGRERGPWWLWVTFVLAIFSAGFYLGRFGGVFFENAVHVGYIHLSMMPRDPTGLGGLAPIAKEPLEKIGPRVFANNCVACHQTNGLGVPGSFPPLVSSPWVIEDPETVVRILIHGLNGPVSVKNQDFNGAMPAWGQTLSNEQIAAVATYIRSSWGNSASAVSVEDVRQIREDTKEQKEPWTSLQLQNLRKK